MISARSQSIDNADKGDVEVSHMNIHSSSTSTAPSYAAEEEVLPSCVPPTHYHGNKAEGKHNKTKAITTHAYQTMFVIAACAVTVACKATQVDAFSASKMFSTRINSSSSSILAPTKSSSSLGQGPSSSSQSSSLLFKYPAFTSNEYKLTAGTGTALFASSRSETKPKKKKKSDEAEWNALLAAFQMYKAAYGDLKVPSRFVVPAMPPWPGE